MTESAHQQAMIHREWKKNVENLQSFCNLKCAEFNWKSRHLLIDKIVSQLGKLRAWKFYLRNSRQLIDIFLLSIFHSPLRWPELTVKNFLFHERILSRSVALISVHFHTHCTPFTLFTHFLVALVICFRSESIKTRWFHVIVSQRFEKIEKNSKITRNRCWIRRIWLISWRCSISDRVIVLI